MVTLNFDGSIDHFVDGLVDNDGCVRLFHYFVDLVATGTDEEGDHALRDENDDGKRLPFDFFEDLINIAKQSSTTLIFMFHVSIKNLLYFNGT